MMSASVAQEWGLVERAPKIPLLKKAEAMSKEIEFLDFDEAEEFLGMVERLYPEQHLLVWLALKSGLRLGELRALLRQHVDLENGTILVCRSVTDRAYQRAVEEGITFDPGVGLPKWKKVRRVELPGDVVQALRREFASRKHRLVFPGQLIGDLRSKGVITKAVMRAAERGKLGRHVHVHMLRHTYASHLVMRGVDLITVQELLGHAQLEMTRRYAHLAAGHKAKQVEVLARPALRAIDGGGSRNGRRMAGERGKDENG